MITINYTKGSKEYAVSFKNGDNALEWMNDASMNDEIHPMQVVFEDKFCFWNCDIVSWDFASKVIRNNAYDFE